MLKIGKIGVKLQIIPPPNAQQRSAPLVPAVCKNAATSEHAMAS